VNQALLKSSSSGFLIHFGGGVGWLVGILHTSTLQDIIEELVTDSFAP